MIIRGQPIGKAGVEVGGWEEAVLGAPFQDDSDPDEDLEDDEGEDGER